ncbi:hypothetical protein K437DRAFT_293285 [Tilletiaria anomala UBC 951]|uniref:Asl1-like glycosyl hydrolase catalytic domain-containing protein n=1 Tax=Tilletiaria anomala (strain ATCC 24038 / CBS 436.72 / UBC 951) TaxID=1037660 RepID=A0A066WDM8_TILAU|nr:uncharacterized protein K437DRAFT_293285 [Tilletiaria anomala UBC 951]KDN52057.1 hypothetical protein K437DRAFT_293285 [Tilletiaria anomala UBC 951]
MVPVSALAPLPRASSTWHAARRVSGNLLQLVADTLLMGHTKTLHIVEAKKKLYQARAGGMTSPESTPPLATGSRGLAYGGNEFNSSSLPNYIIVHNEPNMETQANSNYMDSADGWMKCIAPYHDMGVKVDRPQLV